MPHNYIHLLQIQAQKAREAAQKTLASQATAGKPGQDLSDVTISPFQRLLQILGGQQR